MTTIPTVEVDPHHIGTNSIHYIPSKIYSSILSAFGNLSYAPKNRCDDTNRTKVKTHLKAPTFQTDYLKTRINLYIQRLTLPGFQ